MLSSTNSHIQRDRNYFYIVAYYKQLTDNYLLGVYYKLRFQLPKSFNQSYKKRLAWQSAIVPISSGSGTAV